MHQRAGVLVLSTSVSIEVTPGSASWSGAKVLAPTGSSAPGALRSPLISVVAVLAAAGAVSAAAAVAASVATSAVAASVAASAGAATVAASAGAAVAAVAAVAVSAAAVAAAGFGVAPDVPESWSSQSRCP